MRFLYKFQINSVIRTADKSVSAEITILANVTDNQAQYRCEAANSATEIPLFESTTLSVHCKYWRSLGHNLHKYINFYYVSLTEKHEQLQLHPRPLRYASNRKN